MVTSPTDSFAKEVISTLHVWASVFLRDCPVPDWNAYKIQTNAGDFAEVLFGNPAAPMVVKATVCFILAEGFTKGILWTTISSAGCVALAITLTIHHIIWSILKEGRRYPWLKHEPSIRQRLAANSTLD